MAVALGVILCLLLRPPSAGASLIHGCTGDCNQTGHVTINELIRCVQGALRGREASGLGLCFEVCDVDGDGKIRVNEIVQAVKFAIDGCPQPAR